MYLSVLHNPKLGEMSRDLRRMNVCPVVMELVFREIRIAISKDGEFDKFLLLWWIALLQV